jgi:hypothetical protein
MTENTNPEMDNEIGQLSQREIAIRTAAKTMYVDEGHPEPKRKIVGFWDVVNMFGLEVVLRIASTIGAALVSATAVGAVMEIMMNQLLTVFHAQTDAVASTKGIFYWSMLAFEGGLMAGGMTDGRKNTSLSGSRWTKIAGFGVTFTAGLMRSLTLIQNPGVEFWVALLFGLVVAAAGPLISYYGSENFGHILQEIQNYQEVLDRKWKEELEDFTKGFRTEYPRIAKQVYGEDRRLRVKYEDEGSPSPTPIEQVRPNFRAELKSLIIARGLTPVQIGDTNQGALVTASTFWGEIGLNRKEKENARKYLNQFREDYAVHPENWK